MTLKEVQVIGYSPRFGLMVCCGSEVEIRVISLVRGLWFGDGVLGPRRKSSRFREKVYSSPKSQRPKL